MHHSGKRDLCLSMIFRSLRAFISYILNPKAFNSVTSYARQRNKVTGFTGASTHQSYYVTRLKQQELNALISEFITQTFTRLQVFPVSFPLWLNLARLRIACLFVGCLP